jgi:hypothetical protein
MTPASPRSPELNAFHRQRSPDDASLAVESSRPQPMTDDDDGWRARLVFLGAEGAPRTGCWPKTAKNSDVTRAAGMISGSSPIVIVIPPPSTAALKCSKIPLRFIATYSGVDSASGSPRRAERNSTMRSGWSKGSGRSTTASSALNTAAVAPMPSASVTIATAEKPRARASWRPATQRRS